MDNSPLARLSAELRNNIYHNALYERRPVAISPHFSFEPALLKTCKQIRKEAELMFYAINAFTAIAHKTKQSWAPLLFWLQHGCKNKTRLIKTLTIRIEVLQMPGPLGEVIEGFDISLLHVLQNSDWGWRDIAAVVGFIVNGADDASRVQSRVVTTNCHHHRAHQLAEFLIMFLAFGQEFHDMITSAAAHKIPIFVEFEERLERRRSPIG